MTADTPPTPPDAVAKLLVECGQPRDPAQWASFHRLARLTALKQDAHGRFHDGHWWRGPLLYALIRRYQPRQILECGTGRGYGALCMAQALVDTGIDGRIWTIDRIPPHHSQPWPIDDGQGPVVRSESLQQVWDRYVDPALRQHIHCLTGDSYTVLSRWPSRGLPPIEFCFIDGGHDYWTVKHDLLQCFRWARPGCTVVLDDYTERRGYGIVRLIDREIRPRMPAEAVEVLAVGARDRTVFGEDVEHRMVVIRGAFVTPSFLHAICPRGSTARFSAWYAALRQARRMRHQN